MTGSFLRRLIAALAIVAGISVGLASTSSAATTGLPVVPTAPVASTGTTSTGPTMSPQALDWWW